MRPRHADAVRCTAAYLARRAAVETVATLPACRYSEQPWSITRGAPGLPAARRRFSRASKCLLPLEPLVQVGRLSTPLHDFPRSAAGLQAALASPRHGGTAGVDGVSLASRPGGRYFIYRPPRVPVCRSISKPTAEIKTQSKRDVDWTERIVGIDTLSSSSCRSASPPLLPPSAAGELPRAARLPIK